MEHPDLPVAEPAYNPAPVVAGQALTTTEPSGWLRIIDKMVDKGVAMEQLSLLLEMQQKYEHEQARKAFVADFAAFKAEAPTAIERTGRVTYPVKGSEKEVEYQHTELDNACQVLVPLLSKNRLAHSWETNQDDKGLVTVTCRLEHEAGHSKAVTLRAMPDASGSKNPIQAVGSAVYYLERYTFLAVTGMAAKHQDDDGAAAGGGKITPGQLDLLNGGIAEVQALGHLKNLPRFLEWLGVAKLEDMNALQHTKAMLELRRLRMKAQAEKGGQP